MSKVEIRELLNAVLKLDRKIQRLLHEETVFVRQEINNSNMRHDLEYEQLQLIWKLEELSDTEEGYE